MRTAGIKVIAPVLIVLAVVALAVIIYLFVYRSSMSRSSGTRKALMSYRRWISMSLQNLLLRS